MDKVVLGLGSSVPLSPPQPYARELFEGMGHTVGLSAGTLVPAFEPLPRTTDTDSCPWQSAETKSALALPGQGRKPRHPGLPFLDCHLSGAEARPGHGRSTTSSAPLTSTTGK